MKLGMNIMPLKDTLHCTSQSLAVNNTELLTRPPSKMGASSAIFAWLEAWDESPFVTAAPNLTIVFSDFFYLLC
jgi:hypothetical protein